MSDGKSILVDTSRCTGCRGCQVACKQWNGLPASPTKQTGSHQNPADFDHQTYKVVRFSDGRHEDTKKPYWYFFSDMCRHCVTPPCQAANANDEIHQDDATGAIIYTAATATIDFDTARNSCPYDVPRQNPENKVLTKCTMCIDRISSGMQPACAHACPTGAIVFGARNDILAEVDRRVTILKKKFPKAKALDPDDVRVIFIVTDDPVKYHEHAES